MIEFRESATGDVAAKLFHRRFGDRIPDAPHHVVAEWLDGSDRKVACYVHFTPLGDILLGGGACVDGDVVRAMPPADRRALREAGGLYHATLAWAMRHFAPRYVAAFGYCGDPLAERVDLAVGFHRTGYRHLLVYWLRDLDEAARSDRIARAHAVGPF